MVDQSVVDHERGLWLVNLIEGQTGQRPCDGGNRNLENRNLGGSSGVTGGIAVDTLEMEQLGSEEAGLLTGR